MMASDRAREADVEIVARAAADELRFDTEPSVRVRFAGTGERDTRQLTRRENIDTPVQPGKTYRRVFSATRISGRLLDGGELD
jgi:hypothetical protein